MAKLILVVTITFIILSLILKTKKVDKIIEGNKVGSLAIMSTVTTILIVSVISSL